MILDNMHILVLSLLLYLQDLITFGSLCLRAIKLYEPCHEAVVFVIKRPPFAVCML